MGRGLAIALHLIQMVGDAIDFDGRLLHRLGRAIRGLSRFVGGGLRLCRGLFGLRCRLLSLGGRGFRLLSLLLVAASRDRYREDEDRQCGKISAHRLHLALGERLDRAHVGLRCAVGPQRQDTYVRGAGFQVSVDAIANLLLIAPCDDRVDQPIGASIFEFAVAPSERFQVVGVVGQAGHIGLHIRARRLASLAGAQSRG